MQTYIYIYIYERSLSLLAQETNITKPVVFFEGALAKTTPCDLSGRPTVAPPTGMSVCVCVCVSERAREREKERERDTFHRRAFSTVLCLKSRD
jgi:hypothetical protein